MGRAIIMLMALIGFAGTALAADKPASGGSSSGSGTSSCPPNSRKKSEGVCICNDGYYKRYGRCERVGF